MKAGGSELLEALERHLPGSRGHADGTATYAFAAAVELELERDHAEAVREAARLHEVGNVYVPANVLVKAAGELTTEEKGLLDSRFASGAELARGAGIPDQVCDWIGAVGERFDGSGPGGLAGERIPIESRIMRAAAPATPPWPRRRRAAAPRWTSAGGLPSRRFVPPPAPSSTPA